MAKNNEKRSFEQAMADLEKIVRAIESGEVPLAQALAQYEQGTELVSYCQKVLAEAEQGSGWPVEDSRGSESK